MKAVKKGFTLVELLVVLGILGVLMAVLYPATTTVRFRAAMTAVGVSGRNLYTSIVDANTARETIGYASVWPRTTTSGSESTGGGRLDIADQPFTTSTDYFNELFNMEKVNDTKNWKPIVSKDALKTLYGNGVKPPRSGGKLTKDNVMWVVAGNVQDEMDDIIPVLVTRNVNCNELLKSYDGQDNSEVGLGTTGGSSYDTPFSNKGFVMITKGGTVIQQEAIYCTYKVIYKQAFEISDEGEDTGEFTYLGPEGQQNPKSK